MMIRLPFLIPAMLATAAPMTVLAQTVGDESVPSAQLIVPGGGGAGVALPQGLNLRSALARVNGEVITGTDIDHRVALMVASNGGNVPAEEMERLRAQVLRNLIDETLQIQAARDNEITIAEAEVDESFQRVAAQNLRRDAAGADAYLRTIGSSARSLKRQIHGELAWSRLLRRNVQPFVEVSEDEVTAVVTKLRADKGSDQYRVGEIYLAATPETEAQTVANARRILDQIRAGGSFAAYARQFSQASTAAVGGDLGWVMRGQLPDGFAEPIARMQVGQVVGPLPAPGGVSILYLIDRRQVLGSDPRDAVLSLKQISIAFPAGTTEAAATPRLAAFAAGIASITSCDAADAAARQLGADIVARSDIVARDLPPVLQTAMAQVQIGQATQPFGSLEEGIRSFVLCGRTLPGDAALPTAETIRDQLLDDRIGKRAQTYLRDLRRDAIIDFN